MLPATGRTSESSLNTIQSIVLKLSSISAFTGADGRKYIWYLQGSIKVLAVGEKSGPIVAKHVDHGRAGTLDLKNEADAAGDMLFITFLAAEGFRGRLHFSWFQAL